LHQINPAVIVNQQLHIAVLDGVAAELRMQAEWDSAAIAAARANRNLAVLTVIPPAVAVRAQVVLVAQAAVV
jgi:hypothetical protein